MPDAWRAYLEMALGLTEAPRKKAQQVAGELVTRGGATAGQLQGLVEDLLSAGVANREALTNIVRYEVDKALGVVGLATAEEVSELTTRVRDLEKRLRDAQARAAAAEAGSGADPEPGGGGTRIEQPAPLPRKVVKKAAAKPATPNAMPSAGRIAATPPPNAASTNIGTDGSPTPDATPAVVIPAPAAVTTPPVKAARPAKGAPAVKAAVKAAPPVKGEPAKKAVPPKKAGKAVKKAAAEHTGFDVPTGTAPAPTAGVKEAAAETELPPVTRTAKRAAKKTAPKPED